MQSVPDRVDHWFHHDLSLHQKWDEFATAHRDQSPVFQKKQDGPLLEADHHARTVHEAFCDLFETELSTFVEGLGVSMDQFQEAFRLSREEEERDGSNFYRWTEVVEFDVFLHLMVGGSQALLERVNELSSDARLEHRRKTTLFPLIVKWAPASFVEMDRVVRQVLKDLSLDLALSKAQRKELLRWSGKLSAEVIGSGGVYGPPPRDEAAWSNYLSFMTSRLGPIALDQLIDAITEHAESQPAPQAEPRSSRAALLECFASLDAFHKGKIELAATCDVITKAGVVPAKAMKRLELKWRSQLTQKRRDQQAVGSTPDDGDGFVMEMLQALDFLEECLRPTSGDDADALMVARLDKVSQTAQDRS